MGFPGSSVVKNPPANAGHTGDMGLIPGLGRSLGGGNRNQQHYSFQDNLMDRGPWWATVPGVTKELDMTEHVCRMWNKLCQIVSEADFCFKIETQCFQF